MICFIILSIFFQFLTPKCTSLCRLVNVYSIVCVCVCVRARYSRRLRSRSTFYTSINIYIDPFLPWRSRLPLECRRPAPFPGLRLDTSDIMPIHFIEIPSYANLDTKSPPPKKNRKFLKQENNPDLLSDDRADKIFANIDFKYFSSRVKMRIACPALKDIYASTFS